ncbi:MAG: RluA family pseudouridine synthase [Candidatus Limnocylindria bacterium]
MTSGGSMVADAVVEADATPGRLDLAVSHAAGVSRAEAQRLIAGGRALVDGRPGRSSDRLRGGERLTVRPLAATSPELLADPMALTTVYEDDSLLIIDKPAGLVVHPGSGHGSGTLVHGLLARLGVTAGGTARHDGEWPWIVHRLDKDTSGLLMVAKTHPARASLRAQLAERTVEKEYLALVRGAPQASRGRVEAPVGRDARNRQRMTVREGGRESVTEYEVIASIGAYTLLSVRPRTGRTHQIRAHLAFLRLPIAGDARYGGGEGPAGLRRQFLHAARLTLRRPADGARVTAWAELPDDLARSLDALGGVVSSSLPVGRGAMVLDTE